MTTFMLLFGGLALLALGAELVVRRGTRLAARLGVSPMVIGLTLVSIGTSAPELAIGVAAAWRDSGGLALGNVAGTNTANVLLILGVAALIRPLGLERRTLRVDLPVMVGASLMLMVLARNSMLGRLEGLLLVAGAALYTLLIAHGARRERRDDLAEQRAAGIEPPPASHTGVAMDTAAVIAGIALIVLGSDWLVEGAIRLSRLLGVSDAFIGLTVVAVGTSLPELVTAVVATLRNARAIAVGNVIGSCVYNILLVLGVTALVPPRAIPVSTELLWVDIPVMTLAAVACWPVFSGSRRVTRFEGGLFVAAYTAYLTYLVLART